MPLGRLRKTPGVGVRTRSREVSRASRGSGAPWLVLDGPGPNNAPNDPGVKRCYSAGSEEPPKSPRSTATWTARTNANAAKDASRACVPSLARLCEGEISHMECDIIVALGL
jgi:hypothetical protein